MPEQTGRKGVALVRAPGPRLAEGIVTHIDRQPVDVGAAMQQHDAYVEALRQAGWSIEYVPGADQHPDAVFVEDTVVVVDDLAVLTSPGASQRRGEVAAVRGAVERCGLRTVQIEPPGALDGGDVLQVGSTVYVGRGGRTNGDGVRQLRALLRPLGRTVVPVELRGVLHLKSAVTALPDGTLVGSRDLLDPTPLARMRAPAEESGAHVVLLGDDLILMAASAPKTAQWLTDLGFDVTSVEIGEFEKLEGCVTCLSVLIPIIGESSPLVSLGS